jgi:hypothetical protein
MEGIALRDEVFCEALRCALALLDGGHPYRLGVVRLLEYCAARAVVTNE